VYFGLVTVPAAPIAMLILPILFGLVYWGLHENRLQQDRGSLLERLHGPVAPSRFMSLLALPAVGTLVYALAWVLHLRWYTNWVFYLLATPLGFILLGISLYQILYKGVRVASEVTR
jgi:hypothetical protein